MKKAFVYKVLFIEERLNPIKYFLMKHKFLQIFLLTFVFSNTLFAQIPTPNNDVFVTNEVSINSDQLEFSPTFFEDGILFISTNVINKKYKVTDVNINKNIMSIFHSMRDEEGKLQKPVPFAIELMSTVHEGPLTFDRTTDNMFFTRNNIKNKKPIKGEDGIIKLQIYTAQRMDNVWKNVEKLPFNDRNSNAAHPSISVDNDKLYFTSDRPGGYGGLDLYVSTRIGEEWGEPVNLGPNINTEDEEAFPFIHADGTLYFSSKGWPGSGDLDIFSAKQVNGEWTKPTNMGVPFNSSKDDFGIIIDRDKKNGYFSSSRNGGIGQDDIYSFFALNSLEKEKEEVPEVEKAITINVTDEATGSVVEEAIVTYMKLDELTLGKAITGLSGAETDGENSTDLVLKLPVDENAKTGLTDFNGQMPLRLKRGSYVVKVEKEGYNAQQIAINSMSEIGEYNIALSKFDANMANSNNGNGNGTGDGTENGTGNGTSTGDPFLDGGIAVSTTIEEGTVIELPNIYYNFNEASIRPDAQSDLDAVASFLLNYPQTEIELMSHTDSRGTDRYNNRLSQRRAEQAVAYLAKKGVEKNRMVPVGYGEKQLRNECNDFTACGEAEHQYNRRTEVKITKMDAPIKVKFINNYPSVISEAPQKSKYSGRSKRTNSGRPTNTAGPVADDTYDPEGMYKVIAGAFSNINNAEKRLVEVRDLGFNNADILKFGNKELYHVVVSSYSSSQAAAATVIQLKSKNVRAFVKN